MNSHISENHGDASPQPEWPATSSDEILTRLAHEWRGRLHALVLNTEIMRMAVRSINELPRAQLLDRLDYQRRALRSMQRLMEQVSERIFERFERAVSSASVTGYGLGQWLVRNIARAHGGDVVLRSVPGHGAAFTLRLPRHL